MYFKVVHRAWWSQNLPEALGALEESLRGALIIIPGPALRVLSRDRQCSASSGGGRSQNPPRRSLALRHAGPRLSRKATEETFAGNSCSGCGGLESVFQARGGANGTPTATQSPPGFPARVWAFAAQIHIRVRLRPGLPRSEII